MAIATLVSIGFRKGQVLIQHWDRETRKGFSETRHIKYDPLTGEFYDKYGYIYRQNGDVPVGRNCMVEAIHPVNAYPVRRYI